LNRTLAEATNKFLLGEVAVLVGRRGDESSVPVLVSCLTEKPEVADYCHSALVQFISDGPLPGDCGGDPAGTIQRWLEWRESYPGNPESDRHQAAD
jgi:hypothetical protein